MSFFSEPYLQTLWLLTLSAGVQLLATLVAVGNFRLMKGHKLLWATLVFALLLMVRERIAVLGLSVTSGIYDFKDAAGKAAISLLLLGFTLGFAAYARTRSAPESKEPRTNGPEV